MQLQAGLMALAVATRQSSAAARATCPRESFWLWQKRYNTHQRAAVKSESVERAEG